MCGINGLIQKKDTIEARINLVKEMNLMTSHRGPDFTSIFSNESVVLGHNRLSILDLHPRSNQPYKFDNLVMVFNGEIYNHAELRNFLRGRNYTFETNSDTEVLIKLFHNLGKNCFKKLEGMYAIAIYDTITNRIVLARDFFGEKPLFINYNNEFICFSSELKALELIQKNKNLRKAINKVSVENYLSYLYIPGSSTIYEEISQILPNELVEICCSSFSEIYRGKIYNNEICEKSCERKTKEALIKSVQNQLKCDVPVALWLSGGIDSSLIAAIARKELNETLNVYTIKFKGNSYLDESFNAKNVAQIFKHDYEEIEIDPSNISQEIIFDSISKLDNPVGNPGALLHHILAPKTKTRTTVVLNGTGGDELFLGYNRYKAFDNARKLNNVLTNKHFKLIISNLLSPFSESRQTRVGNFKRSISKIIESANDDSSIFINNLLKYTPNLPRENMLRIDNTETNWLDYFSKIDILNYLPNDLLYIADIYSMQSALEIRSPFLNYELFKSSFGLKQNYKSDPVGSKSILLKWLNNYSDNRYLKQSKKGFSFSFENYFNKAYNYKKMKDLLQNEAELPDIVSEDYVNLILNNFYNKKTDSVIQLYSLYVLANWRKIKNV